MVGLVFISDFIDLTLLASRSKKTMALSSIFKDFIDEVSTNPSLLLLLNDLFEMLSLSHLLLMLS